MTLPGLVRANNLSDVVDREEAWDNLGVNIKSPAGDPYYNQTSLLLKGNGINGSTTIIDSSPSPKVVTVVGNAQISTAASKFGGASIAFDGNGDRLTLAAGSDWNFSGGPHTFECWFYLNALPGVGNNLRLAMAGLNNAATSFVFASISSSGAISVSVPVGGASGIVHSSSVSLNTWYHYACVLNGTSSALYLNGVGTFGTITMPTSSNTNQLFIGYDTVGTVNFNLNGYIDDLRITKGVARYTSNFTPPTAPFPSVNIFTIKGRDILALNGASNASTRDFVFTKNLTAAAQPRITIAAQNTASGVARRDLAMPKTAPTTSGNYFFSSGVVLSGVTTRINGTNALSISTTPFSGSTATTSLLFAGLRPQANWRITEPMTSGTIASPELAIPFETNDFVLYMKTGQN